MFNLTFMDRYGNTVTNLTQWDTNQDLYIEANTFNKIPQFHFCNKNSEKALVVRAIVEDELLKISIPNILLVEPYSITIYAYVSELEDDVKIGKTVEYVQLPVRPRPEPDSFTYENNVDIIDLQTIADEIVALNNEMRLSENLRIQSENERNEAELQRVANENTRQSNEEKRQIAINQVTDITTQASDAATRANNAAQECEDFLSNIGNNTDFVYSSEKGVANGIATLGADGKIPSHQLPDNLNGGGENSSIEGLEATTEELNYLTGTTSNVQEQLNNKVDAVDGKGLSTNDFTNEHKNKLENLSESGGGNGSDSTAYAPKKYVFNPNESDQKKYLRIKVPFTIPYVVYCLSGENDISYDFSYIDYNIRFKVRLEYDRSDWAEYLVTGKLNVNNRWEYGRSVGYSNYNYENSWYSSDFGNRPNYFRYITTEGNINTFSDELFNKFNIDKEEEFSVQEIYTHYLLIDINSETIKRIIISDVECEPFVDSYEELDSHNILMGFAEEISKKEDWEISFEDEIGEEYGYSYDTHNVIKNPLMNFPGSPVILAPYSPEDIRALWVDITNMDAIKLKIYNSETSAWVTINQ